MEEAHQFVPEPSGLNFGAPGRDNAIKSSSLITLVSANMEGWKDTSKRFLLFAPSVLGVNEQ